MHYYCTTAALLDKKMVSAAGWWADSIYVGLSLCTLHCYISIIGYSVLYSTDTIKWLASIV